MKKLLSLAIITTFVIAATYFSSCNNNDKTQPETPATTTTTDNDTMVSTLDRVIADGKYLANHVAGCMDCHSKRDFTKFSGPVVRGSEGGGGMVFDMKFGLPGTVYGKNITPDSTTGIGKWTDDELLRAMTQGISRNGDTLFPLMPYPSYNRMDKRDLMSIIAYLRTLAPIKNEVPKRNLMVPIAMVYPGKFLQKTISVEARPDEKDRVKYGEYLTTLADCGNCHSPLTPQGPDHKRMFAGGYTFDLGSNKVNSANITSDNATGIGTWTEQRFLDKFIAYRDSTQYMFNPGAQNTIMPLSLYAGMKDGDLKAIYAYLRTVKPIRNMVEKFPKN